MKIHLSDEELLTIATHLPFLLPDLTSNELFALSKIIVSPDGDDGKTTPDEPGLPNLVAQFRCESLLYRHEIHKSEMNSVTENLKLWYLIDYINASGEDDIPEDLLYLKEKALHIIQESDNPPPMPDNIREKLGLKGQDTRDQEEQDAVIGGIIEYLHNPKTKHDLLSAINKLPNTYKDIHLLVTAFLGNIDDMMPLKVH